jgi:hypothetical protein
MLDLPVDKPGTVVLCQGSHSQKYELDFRYLRGQWPCQNEIDGTGGGIHGKIFYFKGTVSRIFWLRIFFMDHHPLSP